MRTGLEARQRAVGGHTLIEMLVAIPIVAILVGILLPAIQAARESARQAACANNLKQLGIALHTYHDTHQGFPAAYFRHRPHDRLPSWSWSTYLLPRLEQAALFDALSVTTAPFGNGGPLAKPSIQSRTRLAEFICPSDLGRDLNHRKGGHAKSNYRAVYGSDVQITIDFQWVTNLNGMFFVNSHVRLNQVTDGSSKTLAMGECVLESSASGKLGALWAGMHGWQGETVNSSDSMWGVNSEPKWRINGAGSQAFGSRHAAGANFLLADSSVQFLRDQIDGRALGRLADRNDGDR